MIGRNTAGISYVGKCGPVFVEAVAEAFGFVAGSDSTVSSATAIYIALGANPEAQRKAQAEIDAFTGLARLPTIADTEHMPYVQAIVKELGRWHTVVPLCTSN
jgi:cytochrome P450